jgi:hypothetical protein
LRKANEAQRLNDAVSAERERNQGEASFQRLAFFADEGHDGKAVA